MNPGASGTIAIRAVRTGPEANETRAAARWVEPTPTAPTPHATARR